MESVALNPETGVARNVDETKLRRFRWSDAPSNYTLQFYSCLHYGHDGCAAGSLQKVLKRHSRRKNHYGIFIGDLCEAVMHNDTRRFALGQGQKGLTMRGPLGEYPVPPELAAEMPFQYLLAEQDLIAPYADYWKLMMPGNHDMKAFPGKANPIKPFCIRNGIPFGDYQTILHLPELRFFLIHGFGGFPTRAQNPAALMARRDTALYSKLHPIVADCDVMITGHHHVGHVISPDRLSMMQGFNNGGPTRRRFRLPPIELENGDRYVAPESRWYASVPSFREGPATCRVDYSEMFGLPPSEIGYLEVEVRNDQVHDVRVVEVE